MGTTFCREREQLVLWPGLRVRACGDHLGPRKLLPAQGWCWVNPAATRLIFLMIEFRPSVGPFDARSSTTQGSVSATVSISARAL